LARVSLTSAVAGLGLWFVVAVALVLLAFVHRNDPPDFSPGRPSAKHFSYRDFLSGGLRTPYQLTATVGFMAGLAGATFGFLAAWQASIDGKPTPASSIAAIIVGTVTVLPLIALWFVDMNNL
jgi:hypothetical protein